MTYNDCLKGIMPTIGQFTKTEIIFYLLFPSAIISTLTLVYFLPAEVKELLTLNYHFFSFSNPSDLLRLYTYHLIHFDILHFAGNLVSFILIYWVLTYLVIQGRGVRMFKVMLLIVFVVIAPALGVLDLMLFGDTVVKQGCGFSGILLAFNGLIPYFSFKYVSKELGINFRVSMVHLLFLVIASGMSIAYIETIRAIVFASTGSFAVALYFYGIYNRYNIEDTRETREKISLVMFSLMMFFWVIVVSFPPELKTSHGIVNIWGHFLGLYLSMVILYFLALRAESVS